MRRLALLLAAACGDPGAIEGVQVRMDFASNDFYAAPFPSDHRIREGGGISIRRFPNPGRIDLIEDLIELVSRDARGFGQTSGIFFSLNEPIGPAEADAFGLNEDAPAFLIDVDPGSETFGRRHPVTIDFREDAGPFGAPNLLTLLPVQGIPLRANAAYAAVVLRSLGDRSGAPLGVSAAMRFIAEDEIPDGLGESGFSRYRTAVEALESLGFNLDDIAGLAVFTTQDATAELIEAKSQLPKAPTPNAALVQAEVFDDYCVFQSTIDMPIYQDGVPPFSDGGGSWQWTSNHLVNQGTEVANLVVTVPRTPMPAGGFPIVNFIRTGGGGDRPLVDRGRHDETGRNIEPGSGPALEIARVGFAGISIDGPHGGLRNITGGDEQFLIFNIVNPVAMRDNIRQSALEILLIPDIVKDLTVTSTKCPGIQGEVRFDSERIVLMGHSMGATIAPLAIAYEPRFRGLILSGAGGSWIENVVHKRSPINIRAFAEVLLDYDDQDRALHTHDPALSLLQWAGEPADPPLYAESIVRKPPATPRHVLMLQGIVDTYIMPPIANATSLSIGLDLAGDPLEPSIESLLPLVSRGRAAYPVQGNLTGTGGTATGVVVQHPEDPFEDGHEIAFQTEPPKHQYRCFLETLFDPMGPRVVEPGTPCL